MPIDPAQVAAVAGGLTKAQVAYLMACGASTAPYQPRHGRTANWALRHGYAKHVWVVGGVEMDFDSIGRLGVWEAATIDGCRLTDLGLAVRAHLLAAKDTPHD